MNFSPRKTRDEPEINLIPFIDEDFVKSVDLEAQRIIVDWDPDF